MVVSEIRSCLTDDDGQTPTITVNCDAQGVHILIKDMATRQVSGLYVDYDSMIEFLENTAHIVKLGKKKYDGKGYPVV